MRVRMSTAGEEPGELRIGGWLPPAEPPEAADDAAVTQMIPAISDDPEPVPPSAAAPESRPRRIGRRTMLAVVASVTTVAVAAGVPLLISALDQPSPEDRVLPAPSTSAWTEEAPTPAPTTGRPTKPPASRGAVRAPAHATTPPATPTRGARQETVQVRTESFEAEDADLDGWARTRHVDAASGDEVVTGVGYRRGELTFTVQVARAGDYDVVIAYVADEQRRAAIEVNRDFVGRVDFPSTGSRETVRTMTVRLPLAAGPNTIEFGNSDGWAPDFDRITLPTS
ncbi:CBM35 domain-containing protein [Asanoa sp. WMMD1127]|uniref:CBM35 domain-containing protein n=1 Tax=Asanoa sp. WMMD1127 TaxID=3016107 RepID=UPI0024176B1B|nr:CBM35 domain-containing protein [Asanoa sp. WMMD1127]MDG4824251.1 CBM35 domain-containing protein [Asanoa sp. WMMD1127]